MNFLKLQPPTFPYLTCLELLVAALTQISALKVRFGRNAGPPNTFNPPPLRGHDFDQIQNLLTLNANISVMRLFFEILTRQFERGAKNTLILTNLNSLALSWTELFKL